MEVKLKKSCIYIYIKEFLPLLSGYTLRVFIDGDYEFLSRIYGISGASGKKLHVHMYTYLIYIVHITNTYREAL